MKDDEVDTGPGEPESRPSSPTKPGPKAAPAAPIPAPAATEQDEVAAAGAREDDGSSVPQQWHSYRAQREFVRQYRRRRILAMTLLGVTVVLALLLAAASTGWLDLHLPVLIRAHGWYALLAATLGAAVGSSELVSRYRDEPLRALGSMAAFIYLLLNAVISVSTFFLLTRYAKTVVPTLADDPLMRSIAAGFGAMAILRSKFFTLRTERGEDVAVGPDAAISAFLSAADRGVDRSRAAKRLSLVFDRTCEVSNYDEVREFIRTSLWAFQNVTEEEQKKLTSKITEIYENSAQEYPNDGLRLQALCYYILAIVGEQDFNQLMDNLIEYSKRKDRSKPPVRGDDARKGQPHARRHPLRAIRASTAE